MTVVESVRLALRRVRTSALAGTPDAVAHLRAEITELRAEVARLGTTPPATPSPAVVTVTISERELATRLFDGSIIYLDPVDIAVTPHIALNGVWEPTITTAWLSVLRPRTTVFDVGANFGYFGLLAASRLNSTAGAQVHVFEANPNLIPYVHKTLSVNWLNEIVTVANVAVSDRPGTVQLTVLEDYIGCSSLQSTKELAGYLGKKMTVSAHETIDVPATTLDDYCAEHGIATIDLLKVDIEGYEEHAYAGMARIVADSPDLVLFLEFTRDAYADPAGFYAQLRADFQHAYTIDGAGALVGVGERSDYASLIGAGPDWVMLVLAKTPLQPQR